MPEGHLDYASRPPVARRPAGVTVARAVLCVGLLAGVAHLLYLHAAPDAPARSGILAAQAVANEAPLAAFDRSLARDAGGRNVVVHFPSLASAEDRKLACVVYFHANYALYPRHVWVGRDDTVVNDAAGLVRGDVPPPPGWCRSHDVTAVVNVPIGRAP